MSGPQWMALGARHPCPPQAGAGCLASTRKIKIWGSSLLCCGQVRARGGREPLALRRSPLQPFKVENVFIPGISGFRQEGQRLPRFLLDPSERNLESPALLVFPCACSGEVSYGAFSPLSGSEGRGDLASGTGTATVMGFQTGCLVVCWAGGIRRGRGWGSAERGLEVVERTSTPSGSKRVGSVG